MRKISGIAAFLFTFLPFMANAGDGVYVGAGGSYNTYDISNAGSTAFTGTTELIVFPQITQGAGFHIEAGLYGSAWGTLHLAYERTAQKGKFSLLEYDTAYNNIAMGGRIGFFDLAKTVKITGVVDLFFLWLNVTGGAIGSGYDADAMYSGMGMDGGIGFMIPVLDVLFINADVLWRFNFYTAASGRDDNGELYKDGLFRHGLSVRAGLNYILPK